MFNGIKNHRSAKQRGNDARELILTTHKLIRIGDKAVEATGLLHLMRRALLLHGRNGEEGRATRLVLLKRVHGRLRGLLVFHHDVLKVCGKRGLNGDHVLVLNRNDLGKRTVNSARRLTLRIRDPALGVLLHNEAHAVAISLELLLHGAEGLDSLRNGIHTKTCLGKLLLKLSSLLVFLVEDDILFFKLTVKLGNRSIVLGNCLLACRKPYGQRCGDALVLGDLL